MPPRDIEDLLGASLDFRAAVGEPEEELRRLAEAWDRGEIGPTAFLPAPGRIGLALLSADLGVRAESVSFLACGALRPVRSEERRVGKECRSRWSPYH